MQMASPSNRSPSVGLAAVDSMAPRRFKGASASNPAAARITRRHTVPADRLHHLPMPALFPFHMNRDHRMRRRHQRQDVENQPENHAKDDRDQQTERRDQREDCYADLGGFRGSTIASTAMG